MALVGCAGLSARADEGCPERAAVWRAVTELASREHPTALTMQAALSSVVLEDLGPRFRVTVHDRTREYDDPDRDCERRAHVAAVFVALVLSPSDAPSEPPPPEKVEPKPEPSRDVPPAAPRPRASPWSIEGAAILTMAPHNGTTLVAPGAGLGAAWASGHWGVALGARLPFSTPTFPVGPATVRFARYPAYLGARWRWRSAPFTGSLEAGGVLSVLRMGEDGFSKTTRFEGGLRLGVSALLDTGPVSPYVGVFSEWIPWPYPLALAPDGPLGHAPSVWVGVAAGMALSFN